MNPLRYIATIAATAVVLTTSTALANTNSPTVEPVHHWPPSGKVSKYAPAQHTPTIGVFSHGRGVGVKHSAPRWR